MNAKRKRTQLSHQQQTVYVSVAQAGAREQLRTLCAWNGDGRQSILGLHSDERLWLAQLSARHLNWAATKACDWLNWCRQTPRLMPSASDVTRLRQEGFRQCSVSLFLSRPVVPWSDWDRGDSASVPCPFSCPVVQPWSDWDRSIPHVSFLLSCWATLFRFVPCPSSFLGAIVFWMGHLSSN